MGLSVVCKYLRTCPWHVRTHTGRLAVPRGTQRRFMESILSEILSIHAPVSDECLLLPIHLCIHTSLVSDTGTCVYLRRSFVCTYACDMHNSTSVVCPLAFACSCTYARAYVHVYVSVQCSGRNHRLLSRTSVRTCKHTYPVTVHVYLHIRAYMRA
jgi:hypothetical protein